MRIEPKASWAGFSIRNIGKGFATEAALAIKSFAINQLKVKKLLARCDCRNLNSARLMEK